MSKVRFITLLIFLPVCSIFAQEKTLSKEEAVAKALENNFGIEIAKGQVEIAENNASILNSGYLPTLTGTAAATYNNNNTTTEFPGQFNEDGIIIKDLRSNIS